VAGRPTPGAAGDGLLTAEDLAALDPVGTQLVLARRLMVDYYRRLLRGEDRAEPLRTARKALRARHPHPYYWAAFICERPAQPWQPPQAEAVAGNR